MKMYRKTLLKRAVSLAVSAAMAVTMVLPINVWAEDTDTAETGICGNRATWSYDADSKTLTISGTGPMDDSPSWGSAQSVMENVIIGEGITAIGGSAFSNCDSIKTVSFPSTLTSIGNSAFNDCDGLLAVDFSNTQVTSIGRGTFQYCDLLETVTMPDTVSSLSYCVFANCTSLKNIDLSDSLKTIGEYSFSRCSSLETILIPDTVTSIGRCAFENCTSLSEIILPQTVTDLYSSAFVGCTGLTSIVIPDGFTYLSDDLFKGCTSLTEVTLPEMLRFIETGAFNGCTALQTVHFGGTETRWDELTTNFTGGNNYYLVNAEIDFAKETDSGSCGDNVNWHYDSAEKTLSISGNGSMSSYSTWYYNGSSHGMAPWSTFEKEIQKVVVEEGVTVIGGYAFYGMTAMESVFLPRTLQNVYGSAFYGCTGLQNVQYAGTQSEWSNVYIHGSNDPLKTAAFIYNGSEESGGGEETGANKGSCGDAAVWSYDEESETLTISGSGAISDYGQTWNSSTGIVITDAPWSTYAGSIKKVVLEEGITSVGCSAFTGCSALAEVVFPSSLKEIECEAFNFCTSITTAVYPGSRVSLSVDSTNEPLLAALSCTENSSGICGTGTKWVFDEVTRTFTLSGTGDITECTWNDTIRYAIENLSIGEYITSIPANAFSSCKKLTSVVIPDHVQSIGHFAFAYCSSMAEVTLPEEMESIEWNAFYQCSALTNITMPKKLQQLGNQVFASCSSLSEISLPEGLERIFSRTFYNCPSLTSIVIPDGVSRIGAYSFSNCTALSEITIPASVTVIEDYAFDRCTALQTVHFGGSEAQWALLAEAGTSGNDPLFDAANITFMQSEASGTCGQYIRWTLADGVLTISGKGNIETSWNQYTTSNGGYWYGPQAAWYPYRADIKTVVIGEGITSIGRYAFYECFNLTDISIAESVTVIYDHAFYKCKALEIITLPESLEEIGAYAFLQCSALTSIRIPENLGYLGVEVFEYCEALTSVEILGKLEAIESGMFFGCGALQNVSLPETIREIKYRVFFGCTALSSVTFGGTPARWDTLMTTVDENENELLKNVSVSAVGETESGVFGTVEWEFNDKTDTLTIRGTGAIPDSFTYEYAPWFAIRSAIKKVVIENGITEIGRFAFYRCSNVTSVSLPESLVDIRDHAFYKCSSLRTLTLPDSVEYIDYYAFLECSSLISITLPEGVTLGGEVFEYCTALTDIELPEGLSVIRAGMFYGCTALQTVNIPASVRQIGYRAFYGCDELQTVYFGGTSVRWDILTEEVLENFNDPLTTATVKCAQTEETGSCGENVVWTYADKKLVISGSGPMDDYAWQCMPWYIFASRLESVEIQEGVTTIGYNAFAECTALQSVSIPSSVTGIHGFAFFGCTSLTEVSIAQGLQTIGDYAFAQCHNLQTVVLPEGVTSLGYNAFWACWSLRSIQLPDTLASIGENAFGGCMSLTSIIIPEGVRYLENGTFANCRTLAEITIPSTVESIGACAFENCGSLGKVYFGGTAERWAVLTENAAAYGNGALLSAELTAGIAEETGSCGKNLSWKFDGSTGVLMIAGSGRMDDYASVNQTPWYAFKNMILAVEVGSGVTSIGNNAFISFGQLERVIFPDSLVEIGDRAFMFTGLTSVTIPDDVVIGTYAFAENTALSSVILGQDVAFSATGTFSGCPLLLTAGPSTGDYNIKLTFGSYTRSIPANIFSYMDSLTSVAIPDSVVEVGENAFNGCRNLTAATLPDGLLSIDRYAFANTGLEKIDIPEKTLTIQEGAFSGCTALKQANLPADLCILYAYVFEGCTSLASIAIPESVTEIGSSAFAGCSALNGVVLPQGLQQLGYGAFMNCTSLTGIAIPDGITQLYHTFAGCVALNSVKLPSGMKVLSGTFSGCSSLASLTIPNAVTTLSGLDGCTSLTTVILPRSLEVITSQTFSGCKKLSSITIPVTVTSIEQSAFDGCSKLAHVYYEGSEEQWKSITIASYGNTMLLSCPNFHYNTELPVATSGSCGEGLIWGFDVTTGKLVISGSGTMTEADPVPWADVASKITAVEIGSGAENIASNSFAGCTSLQTITIPETVTVIGGNAFDGCTGLTSVNYAGSAEQWSAVTVESGNDALASAEMHYAIAGDINWDGFTNGEDVILLTRYLSGWEGIVVQDGAADVNGDGKVNALDAVNLTRVVAGWDGYQTTE